MKQLFRRFARDETGAVTVDFVVLTAGIIFLAIGVFQVLREAIYVDAATAIAGGVDRAVQMGNP